MKYGNESITGNPYSRTTTAGTASAVLRAETADQSRELHILLLVVDMTVMGLYQCISFLPGFGRSSLSLSLYVKKS